MSTKNYLNIAKVDNSKTLYFLFIQFVLILPIFLIQDGIKPKEADADVLTLDVPAPST